MVRIDCHKRAYAKINIVENCTIKQNHTSYNFKWLLMRLNIHAMIKEKTGLCFKASNIFTYNYFIHKCLQGPTVCYAICYRKTWLLFYLFILPKPVFFSVHLKIRTKVTFSKIMKGLVSWLVFSKLQTVSVVLLSNQNIKKQKLQWRIQSGRKNKQIKPPTV